MGPGDNTEAELNKYSCDQHNLFAKSGICLLAMPESRKAEQH